VLAAADGRVDCVLAWAVGSWPVSARMAATAGGTGGDGGEDRDLVHVGVVEGLDVEGLIQRSLDGFGVQVAGLGE
jgi:hypothetical protein